MRDCSPSPEGCEDNKPEDEDWEEGEKATHPDHKRACLDSMSDSSKPVYLWDTTDSIWVTLPIGLEKTQKLLKLYTSDPKGAKLSLLNQLDCPEFPDGEWKNVLAGCTINLDNVLSEYHSTSNNDEHIEILGDLEFKVPSVTPNKVVKTTGDWSIAWNKTIHATIFAFPHRSKELYSHVSLLSIMLSSATWGHDAMWSSQIYTNSLTLNKSYG
jgi:hypothetical protein